MRKILLFILITLFLGSGVYADNTGFFASNLTIKELSKNIEKLKKENDVFQEETNKQKWEYWELISFIKTDLTDEEIDWIQEKIDLYINARDRIEKILKEKIENLEDTQKEKNELILQKANLYKYLAKFVAKDKRNDFLDYIKFQIKSEKESKDLIEEILKNQFILDQKVSYIKWKIEEHKEDLQARIETSITKKMSQRINEIDTDPKYKKIDQKVKNKIYNDFINQIKTKLKEIEESKLSDNYKEMRKKIFEKMIEEIKARIKY